LIAILLTSQSLEELIQALLLLCALVGVLGTELVTQATNL
jgi:hypothetical protein